MPPTIVLSGQTNMTISLGSVYVEPGYTATDDTDGDITDMVTITGTVDTNTLGTYTISYTVSDSSGNTATQTRTVTVLPNTQPPAHVTGLRASSTSDSVTLTWDDPNDTSITGYKIFWRLSTYQSQYMVLVNNTGSSDTSYTVQDLEPNTAYAFRVVAINDYGESKIRYYVSVSTQGAGE